ncbi:MAG: shikimate dehydrogenase [Clostridia bacterium]|nr:shikimate dehydrogenase [Clostridia bacterium]
MVLNLEEFKKFTPKKKTIAVMGKPIHHSLSPILHTEFSKETGIDFDYIALEVSPDEFPAALKLAKEKLCGFNLTMPLKQTVIPYLDEADKEVTLTQSANTVVINNGRLHGYTTDGVGLVDALLLKTETLKNKAVLILGAGGAARSVASALVASGVVVSVAVRSEEKGKAFSSILPCNYVLFDDIYDKYDILINATPVGMNDDDLPPIDISKLQRLTLVYDCIYNPPMTKLLRDARDSGIAYDNGLSMLVLQGAYSEQYWFSADISNAVIDSIMRKLRASQALARLAEVHGKSNIVLTGFMGCGKTTIGKMLADAIGFDFVDLDEKIESEQNMKITEIFSKYGEEFFRKLERNACQDCTNLKHTVIATGGGTVIRSDNAEILKKNSLLIFLNKKLDEIYRNLEGSTNRPLLMVENVHEHIRSLYEFRQPQYLERSELDVTFPDGAEPVNEILLSI